MLRETHPFFIRRIPVASHDALNGNVLEGSNTALGILGTTTHDSRKVDWGDVCSPDVSQQLLRSDYQPFVMGAAAGPGLGCTMNLLGNLSDLQGESLACLYAAWTRRRLQLVDLGP